MAIRIQPVRAALAVNLFSLAAMALSDRVLCTIRHAPSFARNHETGIEGHRFSERPSAGEG